MNKLIKKIKDICDQYPVRPKILLMPSYAEGRELLQSAVLAGVNFLNLEVETVSGLALRQIEDYLYRNNLSLIGSTASRLLFLQLLEECSAQGSLKYFDNLEFTPGVLRALHGAVCDLRAAGCKYNDLSEDQFILAEKGRDIIFLLKKYEEKLAQTKSLDRADILQMALNELENKDISSIKNFKKNIYIQLKNIKYNKLEKKYIDKLTCDNKHHLYINLYHEEENPENYSDRFSAGSNCKSKDNLQIKLLRFHGENNEVKGVFREIKKRKLALDEVLILTTAAEPYNYLVYNTAQKMGLPLTTGEGIDIKHTAPGKLYFVLLNWVKDNFNVSRICSILSSDLIKSPDNNTVSLQQAAAILKESGIGWKPTRYRTVLQRKVEEYQKKINACKDKARKEYYQKELHNLQGTKDFMEEIINCLYTEGKEIEELAQGLFKVISRHAVTKSKYDKEAYDHIREKLDSFINYYHGDKKSELLLDRLEELIKGSRVGALLSKPGSLHLGNFEDGLYLERENVFILGLDAGRFPGQMLEDPVLLDSERKKINGMELKQNKVKEKVEKMRCFLSGTDSNLYLSYSCFDILENREMAPSPLILQLGRIVSGNRDMDYSELEQYLPRPGAFIAEDEREILDEGEYWLKRSLLDEEKLGINLFNRVYPETAEGQKALSRRYNGEFNDYNGNIEIASCDHDPRYNQNIIMSASKLENLAACPYKYFLENILRIRLPEERAYDPASWLDPMERGLLLHKIYEEFYKYLKAKNEKPSLNKDLQLIYKIAEENLERLKEIIPPPSQLIYEKEAEEIKQSCYIFLSSESANQETTPVYFELAFGINSGDSRDVVNLSLPGGNSFKLRGIIDRIDKVDENTYNIIDYKTGSKYAYSNREYFKNGRQLQHALYALAAEKILGEKKTIDKAGYFFPSTKGQGERIMRPAEGREKVLEIVEILFDSIHDGIFPASRYGSQGYCSYCDYNIICNREKDDVLTGLWKEKNITELEELKGLDDYE